MPSCRAKQLLCLAATALLFGAQEVRVPSGVRVVDSTVFQNNTAMGGGAAIWQSNTTGALWVDGATFEGHVSTHHNNTVASVVFVLVS